MKPFPLFLIVFTSIALSSCRTASRQPPDADVQQQHRVTELENQLTGLRQTNDHWQTLAASLGVGCVVLLILGTALGAKTRHDAFPTS